MIIIPCSDHHLSFPSVRSSVHQIISQLVVSAMYSVINSRSSLDQLNDTPVTDGQWDMMIAVGERLCSLHDGNYDSHLKRMTLALLSQWVGRKLTNTHSFLFVYRINICNFFFLMCWFGCLHIFVVFPSVVHSLPLSPLPSVHSKYLFFFGENCTFFVSFKQIPFCKFFLVSS